MTWGPNPVETRGMLRDLSPRFCAGLLGAALALGCTREESEARARVGSVEQAETPLALGTRASDLILAAGAGDTAKVKDKAEVTFSGYQSLPGDRGIVFVELTQPVAVEVSRKGQVIEYKLLGASVPLRNNKNPLLLRDFASSAMTAQLVPDKKSVRLVITLRDSVTPSHRMVARGKGAALEVELPPPKASVNGAK